MKISIAERLHPFSHQPGTACLLPLSTWQATIYPTRVVLQKMSDPLECVTLDLVLQGPFQEFTIEVDLEKGVIRVFGRAKQGFLRYEIKRVEHGIVFNFEKLPSSKVTCVQAEGKKTHELSDKETLLIPLSPEQASASIPRTRLSLGMHKAQDWDLVLRRFDLKEIFPVLMRLGAMVPSKAVPYEPKGTLALLNAFQTACIECKKLAAVATCEQWLQASFTGVLVPALTDLLFQGILPSSELIPNNPACLAHLVEGARTILSLFFRETAQQWDILPCLLPVFHAGRLTNLETGQQDMLSIEWSKHELKKLIIQTHQTRSQHLKLPKEIRSFRVRTNLREKGKVVHVDGGLAQIELRANTQLFVDRFKK